MSDRDAWIATQPNSPTAKRRTGAIAASHLRLGWVVGFNPREYLPFGKPRREDRRPAADYTGSAWPQSPHLLGVRMTPYSKSFICKQIYPFGYDKSIRVSGRKCTEWGNSAPVTRATRIRAPRGDRVGSDSL